MNDPIYEKIENTPRPSIFAASGFMLLAAAGLWLTSLLQWALPGIPTALVNAAYYLPFVGLPMLLYARRHRGLGEGMRLNPLPAPPLLAVALLALLSVYAASILAAGWGWMLESLGLRAPGGAALPQTRGELLRAIVSMAALPAVCEELLFRGFALSAWESRGTAWAVGVTAALFALLHGNLFGLPAYLLVGAVSGFLTFALDSLYAGIAYHTLYNAACLVIPWLIGGEGSGEAAAASGSLALSLALELVTLAAMMAALIVALRLRARTAGIEPIPRVRRPLARRDRRMLALLLAELLLTILAVAALAVLAAKGGHL